MRTGIFVQATRGHVRAPHEAVVASPAWNVLEPSVRHMINAETGELLDVTVHGPAAEVVRAANRDIRCQRYRVTGDLRATLWYDSQGLLVRKRLRAPDDSMIETLLQRQGQGPR